MASMLVLVAPALAHAATPGFAGGSEALAAANSLSGAGVLSGWDASQGVPQQYVTRGQLASLLARALGLTDSALLEAGVIPGATATTLASDQLVSRMQAVLWIMNALGYKVSQQPSESVPFSFSYSEPADTWVGGFVDRPLISSECVGAVANAYRLGIVDATGGGWFYPTLPAAWGDLVIMLDRAFVQPIVVKVDYPPVLTATSSYPVVTEGADSALAWYLEYRLTALKYCPGPIDGVYDFRTRDAVIAFQKVERLYRDGVAGGEVWQRMPVASTPTPRRAGLGTRVEVDVPRQVLFMITNNKVWKIVHVSTGKKGRATWSGHWKIGKKYRGNIKCTKLTGYMYYPSRVHGGTYIHGYASVPTYPASHGCVRVPMWMAVELYNQMPKGTVVDIYY